MFSINQRLILMRSLVFGVATVIVLAAYSFGDSPNPPELHPVNGVHVAPMVHATLFILYSGTGLMRELKNLEFSQTETLHNLAFTQNLGTISILPTGIVHTNPHLIYSSLIEDPRTVCELLNQEFHPVGFFLYGYHEQTTIEEVAKKVGARSLSLNGLTIYQHSDEKKETLKEVFMGIHGITTPILDITVEYEKIAATLHTLNRDNKLVEEILHLQIPASVTLKILAFTEKFETILFSHAGMNPPNRCHLLYSSLIDDNRTVYESLNRQFLPGLVLYGYKEKLVWITFDLPGQHNGIYHDTHPPPPRRFVSETTIEEVGKTVVAKPLSLNGVMIHPGQMKETLEEVFMQFMRIHGKTTPTLHMTVKLKQESVSMPKDIMPPVNQSMIPVKLYIRDGNDTSPKELDIVPQKMLKDFATTEGLNTILIPHAEGKRSNIHLYTSLHDDPRTFGEVFPVGAFIGRTTLHGFQKKLVFVNFFDVPLIGTNTYQQSNLPERPFDGETPIAEVAQQVGASVMYLLGNGVPIFPHPDQKMETLEEVFKRSGETEPMLKFAVKYQHQLERRIPEHVLVKFFNVSPTQPDTSHPSQLQFAVGMKIEEVAQQIGASTMHLLENLVPIYPNPARQKETLGAVLMRSRETEPVLRFAVIFPPRRVFGHLGLPIANVVLHH